MRTTERLHMWLGRLGSGVGGGARWEAFYIDGIHATQEFVTVEREKCKTW